MMTLKSPEEIRSDEACCERERGFTSRKHNYSQTTEKQIRKNQGLRDLTDLTPDRQIWGVYVIVKEEGRGETKKVKVCETEEQLQSITVRQLKEKIKQEFGLTHPRDRVDLTFEGKVLEDHHCLSHYGIRNGSTICFKRRRSMDRPPAGVAVPQSSCSVS